MTIVAQNDSFVYKHPNGTTGAMAQAVLAVSGGTMNADGTITAGGVISKIDPNNSTSAVLANGAVFTGTATDVSRYAAINVSVFADQASATDGLSMQQSSNGTNWDVTDVYTVAATSAGNGKTFSVQVSANFFRVVYTNGGVTQGAFRLQTLLKLNTNPTSSVRPSFARSLQNDMQETIAYGGVSNGATLDLVTKPNLTSRLLSALASVNLTAVRTAATDLFNLDGYNNNAAARFLKIYSKASAVTVGNDVPVRTMRLPPTAQFSFSFNPPLYLPLGFEYAFTTAAADNDTGALTAGDIVAFNADYSAAV